MSETSFAIHCLDAANSAEPRRQHLKAHLAYVETIRDRLRVGGPLVDHNGEMIGSLIILAAADEEEAKAILESDPYCRAGIWKDVRIDRFRPVAGSWVGGKSW